MLSRLQHQVAEIIAGLEEAAGFALAGGMLCVIISATLWCYIMPTKHARIGVVKDEALQEALESVASIVGTTTPAATVVHDLAIRGARAIQDDAARRDEFLRDLAAWSTGDAPPWDRDVLARIDEISGE